jgi:prepilin-type N-terminal cleavage/methylation domain-containing protein
MRTSATTRPTGASRRAPPAAPRPPDRAAGFTLLEVLIVAFLIGILSSIFLPRLGKRFGFDLDNAGEVMSAELRYAAERAVSTGDPHRLVIDLDAQELRLERIAVNEPPPAFELPGSPSLLDLKPPRPEQESKPVPERQGDWHSISADDVRIEAVLIGEEEFDQDKVAIAFGGDGGADPASVRLVDGEGNRLILSVQPFTGEVKVQRPEEP